MSDDTSIITVHTRSMRWAVPPGQLELHASLLDAVIFGAEPLPMPHPRPSMEVDPPGIPEGQPVYVFARDGGKLARMAVQEPRVLAVAHVLSWLMGGRLMVPAPEQRDNVHSYETKATEAVVDATWSDDRDAITRDVQRHALTMVRQFWPDTWTEDTPQRVYDILHELGSLTDSGVSGLSMALHGYIVALGDTDGLAAQWIENDQGLQGDAESQPRLPDTGEVQPLPGWTATNEDGTTDAYVSLTHAVWHNGLKQRYERHRAMPPGMPDCQLALLTRVAGMRPGEVRMVGDSSRGELVLPGGQLPEPLASVELELVPGMNEQHVLQAIKQLNSVYSWRLLDLFMRKLDEDFAVNGPCRYNRAPRVFIPTGRRLAADLGMGKPENLTGKEGRKADQMVETMSRLRLAASKGNEWRIFSHEPIAEAPGRPRVWALTAGLASVQGWHRTAPRSAYGGARRFVAWVDVLPDVEWVSAARFKGDATRLGMHIVLMLRRAAGKQHGRSWLNRPGMAIADVMDAPRELGLKVKTEDALGEWLDDGWLAQEDGLLVPGARQPRLREQLDDAARGARRQRGRKSR